MNKPPNAITGEPQGRDPQAHHGDVNPPAYRSMAGRGIAAPPVAS
jgi:hypothetical protein